MGSMDEREGLNIPQSTLTEFFEDVEGKLAMLTDIVDYKTFGLTLEDIRRPLLVVGLPGIGKTCGIISSIKEMNKTLPPNKQLGFKKILLGQTVVGSLSGIPVAQADGSVIRVQIPDLPDPVRDGEYGVLFLDEITTADEMQIQPALGLADDSRSLGEYTLPEHWIVIGAGNGPDCTNFVRLDDMTLSRFSAYDISYDYKEDFRPYAHASGIDSDIIAFLNFSPDSCVRVESTDMDSSGKMFPCPRTWERLSTELKMRKARGKAVPYEQLANFAGRIVGSKAGREFAAFMAFKKDLKVDPESILNGSAKAPNPNSGMAKETFHILLEGMFKILKDDLKGNVGKNDVIPTELYDRIGNLFEWIFSFVEMENQINAIMEIKHDIPALTSIMFDDDFVSQYAPQIDKFFSDHAELLQSEAENLENLKF